MKHVIIFQDVVNDVTYGTQWKQDELFSYFRAQIDNALRVGVDLEDIIVCTNLDFSYKDATIIKLKEECKFNKYFNKQYGIWELLRDKHITEPFWFHDFDDWALHKFDFPEFDGVIGMCKYCNDSQWNTGSIFVKPESVDIWELVVNFMKENKNHPSVINKGDENVINMVYNLYPELKTQISKLDTRYNVGCTEFDFRRNMATKPILVGAFKPTWQTQKGGIKVFRDANLIPNELNSIFNSHLSDYYETSINNYKDR